MLTSFRPGPHRARVAQLDRASVSEAEGCGFDPRPVHHFYFVDYQCLADRPVERICFSEQIPNNRRVQAKTPDFPITLTKGSVSAKIYRHENKGYAEFKVAYYVGTRRKLESFADLDEAKRRAREAIVGIGAGDHATLTLKADDRIVYQRALKFLNQCETPLDVAAERYASAAFKLGKVPLRDAVEYYLQRFPQNMPSKSVREVVDEMIAAKKADGASAPYLRDLKFRLGEFTESFQCPIASVDMPLVNEWLRALKCAGRTRNNFRTILGTLFNYAEAEGYLPKDHVDFDTVARAREEQTEIEIFSPKEMMGLLEAAQMNPDVLGAGFNRRYATRQGLLPLLVLGGFAGMRTAEIQRQLWDDINLERGYIRVTGVKGNTAQKRLIPICDNLRTWLAVCRREVPTCCDYPRPFEAIQRLAERAEVKWKHNALRHSCISYRVALTGDVARVALESGNSPRMIFRHYRELVTKEEAQTWFSIMPKATVDIVPMDQSALA